MNMNRKAWALMGVGITMMVIGWLMLFLQVLRVFEPTIATSFFAYGLSFAGFVVGLGGVVRFFQIKRRRETN